MNWKDKFIISWLNKKADINKTTDLDSILNMYKEGTTKYNFCKLLIDRQFKNAPNFTKSKFKWFLTQLNLIIPKEDWKTKEADDIYRDIQQIIYKNVNYLNDLSEIVTEVSQVNFKNFDGLELEVNRLKLTKEKKQLQEIPKEEQEEPEVPEVPQIVFQYDLDNNHYDVYLPKTIPQLSYIGRGTSWCFGEDYINEEGPNSVESYYKKIKDGYHLYVIYKNNEPYVAIHEESNQWLNINDKKLTIEQYEEIMPVIEKFHIYSILYELYELKMIDREQIDEYLPVIINNANLACEYAKNVLHDRWQQNTNIGKTAEKTISKNKYILYDYICFLANNEIIYKNELLEMINKYKSYNNLIDLYPSIIDIEELDNYIEIILNNPFLSYYYIQRLYEVKNKKHIEKYLDKLEYSIAQNSDFALNYSFHFLYKRWPQNTETGRMAEISIAQNAKNAFLYAHKFDCKLWRKNTEAGKIAEKNMANDTEFAYKYAFYCLEQRWPEENGLREISEQNIAKNFQNLSHYKTLYNIKYDEISKYCAEYEKENCQNAEKALKYSFFIKERWPQNEYGKIAEINIAQNLCRAYDYAKYCIKGRWPQNEEVGKIAEENIRKSNFYWKEYCKLFNIQE